MTDDNARQLITEARLLQLAPPLLDVYGRIQELVDKLAEVTNELERRVEPPQVRTHRKVLQGMKL